MVMNTALIQKYGYPAAIILLIVAFNITLYMHIEQRISLHIPIASLILLLVLIALQRFSFKPSKKILQILILVGLGIIFVVTSNVLTIIYAVIGLLTAVPGRIMIHGDLKWWPIGGNPLKNLDDTEKNHTIYGLSILLSTAAAFFVKVIWLANSI